MAVAALAHQSYPHTRHMRLPPVVMQHDDSIIGDTNTYIRQIIDQHKVRGGAAGDAGGGVRESDRGRQIHDSLMTLPPPPFSLQNPNGCNTPATFYAIELNTDCLLAKAFFLENSEVSGTALAAPICSSSLHRRGARTANCFLDTSQCSSPVVQIALHTVHHIQLTEPFQGGIGGCSMA